MDNDGFLAGGMTSPEVFGNEHQPEDVQQALDSEREYISAILPTAEKEIKDLNLEIANANKLTDFIAALGVLPSDLQEEKLRAKLEARFAYINYLITRKNRITDGLRQINQEVTDEPIEFEAPGELIKLVRFKSVWQRLKGLWPM